jgi:hypothetical protein
MNPHHSKEFKRMHADNKLKVQRPIGTAIDINGYWLWGGVEIQASVATEKHDLGNGTFIDLKSGEVFSRN